jgi:hypothetical protein
MDSSRLDCIARRLAEAQTRRQAAKTVVGGTLAAVGLARVAGEAGAQCLARGTVCTSDEACCSHCCVSGQQAGTLRCRRRRRCRT